MDSDFLLFFSFLRLFNWQREQPFYNNNTNTQLPASTSLQIASFYPLLFHYLAEMSTSAKKYVGWILESVGETFKKKLIIDLRCIAVEIKCKTRYVKFENRVKLGRSQMRFHSKINRQLINYGYGNSPPLGCRTAKAWSDKGSQSKTAKHLAKVTTPFELL